jgi:hypothetical protein
MQKPPREGGGSAYGLGIWPLLLDGEGVFELFHAGLQILDFAPLLFHEQVLNLPESYLESVDVLFGDCGLEALVDHDGELWPPHPVGWRVCSQ